MTYANFGEELVSLMVVVFSSAVVCPESQHVVSSLVEKHCVVELDKCRYFVLSLHEIDCEKAAKVILEGYEVTSAS